MFLEFTICAIWCHIFLEKERKIRYLTVNTGEAWLDTVRANIPPAIDKSVKSSANFKLLVQTDTPHTHSQTYSIRRDHAGLTG